VGGELGTFRDRIVQVVADLLTDDYCHICGRRDTRVRPTGGYAAHVCSPVRVSVARIARIVNNPICGQCALGLVESDPDFPEGRETIGGVPVITPFKTNTFLLQVIHTLKFGRISSISAPLGHAVAAALEDSPISPDILVPVPMDRRAQARRGFNQALELARVVSASRAIPVEPRALCKVRRTHPQSSLPGSEREGNVIGAFACAGKISANKSVVLVDDLVTTGATAAACINVLRGSGVETVAVLAVGTAL